MKTLLTTIALAAATATAASSATMTLVIFDNGKIVDQGDSEIEQSCEEALYTIYNHPEIEVDKRPMIEDDWMGGIYYMDGYEIYWVCKD